MMGAAERLVPTGHLRRWLFMLLSWGSPIVATNWSTWHPINSSLDTMASKHLLRSSPRNGASISCQFPGVTSASAERSRARDRATAMIAAESEIRTSPADTFFFHDIQLLASSHTSDG